jgi:hypothetical protein
MAVGEGLEKWRRGLSRQDGEELKSGNKARLVSTVEDVVERERERERERSLCAFGLSPQ